MTIRWRVAVLTLQVLSLLVVTQAVTGSPLSTSTWFAAIAAYAFNTQLLEPYYTRPVDTLANSALGLVLIGLSSHMYAREAWLVLGVFLGLALLLSLTAILIGVHREPGIVGRINAVLRTVTRGATAGVIYTAVFWPALLEYTHGVQAAFWSLSLAWVIPFVLGAVNWEAAAAAVGGGSQPATVEGMVGPSKLLVSCPPTTSTALGDTLLLKRNSLAVGATVIGRIRRTADVWLELHVRDARQCEKLASGGSIMLSRSGVAADDVIGAVEPSSNHQGLCFSPVSPLKVGQVVTVKEEEGQVLYQVSSAKVESSSVRGGAQLSVRVWATQLGTLDLMSKCLRRHRWVPRPGAPVSPVPAVPDDLSTPEPGSFLVGHLIGTKVPIFLQVSALGEGHLAILGMTRMGKSTLALRLARALGVSRSVVIMDQTAEYRTRGGLGVYDPTLHSRANGLWVFEPPPKPPVPDSGLGHLRDTLNTAYKEYKVGTPFPRALVIDEAHQFVPEPAMLGFGTPGRDSAIKFGMYMMQVRKFGMSIVLISQRTAVVAKSALSQCENVIAFKSVDQTGLEYLEAVLGSGARELLPVLAQGEALVHGPAFSSDAAVAVSVARGP